MAKYALYSNCFGSGKSTVADHLVNSHHYSKLTLASGLKEYVHERLHEDEIDYDPNDKASLLSTGKTLRDYYISHGTRLAIERGAAWMIPDEWESMDDVVVDDLRRPEELEKLISFGFIPVFIDRLLETPDNPLEGLLSFDPTSHLYVPNVFNMRTLHTLVDKILIENTGGDDQVVANVVAAYHKAKLSRNKIAAQAYTLNLSIKPKQITVMSQFRNEEEMASSEGHLKLTNVLHPILHTINKVVEEYIPTESLYNDGAAQLLTPEDTNHE